MWLGAGVNGAADACLYPKENQELPGDWNGKIDVDWAGH